MNSWVCSLFLNKDLIEWKGERISKKLQTCETKVTADWPLVGHLQKFAVINCQNITFCGISKIGMRHSHSFIEFWDAI